MFEMVFINEREGKAIIRDYQNQGMLYAVDVAYTGEGVVAATLEPAGLWLPALRGTALDGEQKTAMSHLVRQLEVCANLTFLGSLEELTQIDPL